MKRISLSTLFIVIFSSGIFGQSDQQQIQAVLSNFIEGTSFNYPEKILSAFHPNTPMYLQNDADTLFVVSAELYASWYSRKAPGTTNNRHGKILGIDVAGDIASAKIETLMPSFGKRFIDLVLLKKIEGQWKIISKAASAEPIPKWPSDMLSQPVKEVVMENLNHPWSMAFISPQQAIIAEKDGDLLLVDLELKTRKPIKGLPTDVARAIKIDTTEHRNGTFPHQAHGRTMSFNAGWFQVLLDPDFSNNQYIYISYAAENEERASTTKVIRGRLYGNQLTEVQILYLAEPYSHGLFHYGGGMIFGRDGKLYITIGERNYYEHLNPALPVAQNLKDKRGKIIRLNPNGSIPEDNPDFGPGATPGLYALGIRASQGLAIDPSTGKIWFSEHGTHQGDELNILTPSANYGWPYQTTGRYRTNNYKPEVPDGLIFTDPVYSFPQTVAPTGLAFYNGREFPLWQGNIILPGLSRGNLWRIVLENEKVISTEEIFVNDRVRIRKAVMSPDGQLYILTDEDNGKLVRIKNRSNNHH